MIGDEVAPARGEAPRGARTVPVAFLRPNRFQPRKTFAQEDLENLASSVKEKGVLQPILVRPIKGQTDAYEIVAGERRWRAAQMAKLHDVPVVVRDLNDIESLEFAIIENVQRADLNALEEAAAYQQLVDLYGYTQVQLAEEIGKSRSHIANTLRLLKLPDSVQAMIRDGQLTAGHARTLIGAADPEALAREIIESELNVREAEQRSKPSPKKGHDAREKDADTKALESSLSNMLGLKVHILDKGERGGEIKIVYKTLEQLDDVCRRLNKS
ncbi:MAG TPA: ParB/RepB/Spo0J family partition protein [Rhizomicrobium sp.]|nr:ParB/RepB/Spo0J family partition protein [Rhizomicrobium sp.]